jgi:hypothetical protein
MLSGLPHKGKSLKHFRLFNWISAGNVRKINLKKYVFV